MPRLKNSNRILFLYIFACDRKICGLLYEILRQNNGYRNKKANRNHCVLNFNGSDWERIVKIDKNPFLSGIDVKFLDLLNKKLGNIPLRTKRLG